jgi:dinuclear metal center YbgI/SA1388 family protein
MTQRSELLAYVDELLNVDAFEDYAPNGLQVAGRDEVRKVVGGVTASQALVDAAVAAGADTLLVHHGYFWRGEDPRVVGMKQRRLKALLAADINLVAYHLPLDAHLELGNNAQLAKQMGWRLEGTFGRGRGPEIGHWGELPAPQTAAALGVELGRRLGRDPLHIGDGEAEIRTLAWCSGAAQDYLAMAAALGVDAFVSGEISEPTVHEARELGIHYFSAGHHATERGGVQALGAHLAAHFGLEFTFIDIDNPA